MRAGSQSMNCTCNGDGHSEHPGACGLHGDEHSGCLVAYAAGQKRRRSHHCVQLQRHWVAALRADRRHCCAHAMPHQQPAYRAKLRNTEDPSSSKGTLHLACLHAPHKYQHASCKPQGKCSLCTYKWGVNSQLSPKQHLQHRRDDAQGCARAVCYGQPALGHSCPFAVAYYGR